MTFSGAIRTDNNYSSVLTYTKKEIVTVPGVDSSPDKKITVDCTKNVEWSSNGKVVAYFDLPKDYYNNYIIWSYEDIKYKFSCWLKKSGDNIDVKADYYHQLRKINVEPWGLAALTADIAVFCISGGGTLVIKAITAGGAVATVVSAVDIDDYYDTAGGKPCNVMFRYK